MKTSDVQKFLDFNSMVFHKNLTDINQETSVKTANSNNINWVLGHVILMRQNFIDLFKLNASIPEAYKNTYGTGSNEVSASAALPLEEMKAKFDEIQNELKSKLSEDKELGEEVSAQLAFHIFHESYHLGQVGTLRRVMGLKGAL